MRRSGVVVVTRKQHQCAHRAAAPPSILSKQNNSKLSPPRFSLCHPLASPRCGLAFFSAITLLSACEPTSFFGILFCKLVRCSLLPCEDPHEINAPARERHLTLLLCVMSSALPPHLLVCSLWIGSGKGCQLFFLLVGLFAQSERSQ